ncbi:MAG TPA: hypothetical protein VEI97_03695 [bacterium]|nr:hypothetical protein [bacterium]
MDREIPRGGGQDATVVAVISAIIFLGTFVAYYYMAYKPKIEEIAALEQQKAAKISELKTKLDTIKEQKNYEVRLAVLQDQWDENKHWFVNGTVNWADRDDVAQTQFAIFSLYQRVVDIARGSGIDVDNRSYKVPFQVKIDEDIKFYLDDKPYDFPREYYFLLENLEFEPTKRFPESAEGTDIAAVTTEGKQLFNAHNFTVAFTGTYEELSRFTKNLQQRFGDEDTLIAVHCYSTDGEKIINGRIFGDYIDSTVQIGYQMYVTAYSIFDAPNISINTPPNLPGETDCKASGGGGGSRGGGGGGGGGGNSGGGVSMGVG